MELDIIKLQTTWNDAAGSLNNNFAKIKQAINTGSGGGSGVAGGGIYEIKYDFLNGNPLSEEDIAFNAEVFDKLSRNEVSALYIVVDDGGEVRFVADSFYYMPPVDGEGDSALLLNFTAETLNLMGLPQMVIQIGSDGSAEEIPLSGSGMTFVHLSRPDEIATFYSNNSELSLLSTLIIDDIDSAAYSLWGRIVDASSGYITYSCSNGDVRRVTFNSDYTIKKRGLIEGVIYLGDNLTDFQKQANLAYATAMKDLNDYDYSNGNKKRVGVVVYYNGDFYNALIFDKSGIVILAGLELQGWIIDEAGNTTLTESVNIGGADIDTSKFATTAQLQELDNILSDEIDGLKDSKQNTISDLDAIRSGAALGATALQEHQDISHLATKTEVEAKYTKPSSGIPKSDLVSEVQESLGKADTAIQNVKTINGNSIEGDGDVSVGSITSVDTGDILDDVDVRYATEQYVDDAIANVDIDTDNLATKEELETLSERLGEKQEKLVSGENIKTINGESVLGSGNITIQGGGSSYDDTELRNSLNAVTERVDDLSSELEDKVNETSLATINGQSLVNEGNVVVGDVVSVATGDVVDDVEMEYATKIYVDNAIAQAIISTINANY